MNSLVLEHLRSEKKMRYRGGVYHKTQVLLAYNSNRIEGSKLTVDQTRSIFETNTIGHETGELLNTNDIIETANHFKAFDYMLDVADQPLSETIIKEFHRILKRGTSDERLTWFKVGDYKLMANEVGGMETVQPKIVPEAIKTLLEGYHAQQSITVEDIISFHEAFESIHPFQDGNGRVGRLVMFKECLKYGVMPFIIDAEHKAYYYRGLKEYGRDKAYLNDTCLSAQDSYRLYCEKLIPVSEQPPKTTAKDDDLER